MLLMVEKETRDGICHAIHRYAKANNKYIKNYDKDIKSPYLMYLDTHNSQKVPVDGFKWVEERSQFQKHFIKSYDENSNKGYFLKADVEYPKNV